MKKMFLFTLVILVVVSLNFIGCAKSSTTSTTSQVQSTNQAQVTTTSKTTTTQSQVTTASKTTTTQQQTIKLLFATSLQQKDDQAKAFEKFGKQIEEKSNGRVKVDFSWAGALVLGQCTW